MNRWAFAAGLAAVVALILLIGSRMGGQEGNWLGVSEGAQVAKREGKPILYKFYADW